MPRKASRKIKVLLEVEESVYQTLAVQAAGRNESVSEYVLANSVGRKKDYVTVPLPFPDKGPEVLLPVTGSVIPPLTLEAHAARSDIESNADSATEREKPRKRR